MSRAFYWGFYPVTQPANGNLVTGVNVGQYIYPDSSTLQVGGFTGQSLTRTTGLQKTWDLSTNITTPTTALNSAGFFGSFTLQDSTTTNVDAWATLLYGAATPTTFPSNCFLTVGGSGTLTFPADVNSPDNAWTISSSGSVVTVGFLTTAVTTYVPYILIHYTGLNATLPLALTTQGDVYLQLVSATTSLATQSVPPVLFNVQALQLASGSIVDINVTTGRATGQGTVPPYVNMNLTGAANNTLASAHWGTNADQSTAKTDGDVVTGSAFNAGAMLILFAAVTVTGNPLTIGFSVSGDSTTFTPINFPLSSFIPTGPWFTTAPQDDAINGQQNVLAVTQAGGTGSVVNALSITLPLAVARLSTRLFTPAGTSTYIGVQAAQFSSSTNAIAACIGPETPVCLADGMTYAPISTLTSGVEVLGFHADGSVGRCRAVVYRQRGTGAPMRRVTFNNGFQLIVSDWHLLLFEPKLVPAHAVCKRCAGEDPDCPRCSSVVVHGYESVLGEDITVAEEIVDEMWHLGFESVPTEPTPIAWQIADGVLSEPYRSLPSIALCHGMQIVGSLFE